MARGKGELPIDRQPKGDGTKEQNGEVERSEVGGQRCSHLLRGKVKCTPSIGEVLPRPSTKCLLRGGVEPATAGTSLVSGFLVRRLDDWWGFGGGGGCVLPFWGAIRGCCRRGWGPGRLWGLLLDAVVLTGWVPSVWLGVWDG